MSIAMFSEFVPDDAGTLTEEEKNEVLSRCITHAEYILDYNRRRPDKCNTCIESICCRELNELIDFFWPLDKSRQAGISFDGETNKYTVHLKNF